MKVILTGATGFIGGEVLVQCLAAPTITSIICLSRRAIPSAILPEEYTTGPDPIVTVILVEDWLEYAPEVLAQLEGAAVCIWALGSPARKNTDMDLCRKIEIGYTVAAAKAFAAALAPQVRSQSNGSRTFRFVYLSGMLANRDAGQTVWFMANSRNIKGEVENQLLSLASATNSPSIHVSIMRPGGVLYKTNRSPELLVAATLSIRVDVLAAVMVDEAVGGGEGANQTYECAAIRARGRALLAGTK